MRHGITIDEHLNDFTKLLANLLNLDKEDGDEDKTLLLLNSLPDEYEKCMMMLIHGKEVMNYIEVIDAFLNHGFWHWDKKSTKMYSTEALISQQGRSEKKKKGDNKHGNTYWELDSGVVTMGNYQAYRICRVGSIFIRMHDGIVKELTDMRHVPDTRKNLLSVGASKTKGYKGFKLYNPVKKKIVIIKDVTFDEASMLKLRDSEQDESSTETIDVLHKLEFGVNPFAPQRQIIST
ncbi:hypothetical protein KFK09_005525 [Dendrobium nobile]|uniref:Retrovirus-related Pol polyprotein from transposon TNT 1-94-like beta-barrel domain-containing protein n=1 Tax=Dendrobium nobile TaxID=94219 RepID=A0A8T3C190_DENNO|nr:hypothetical protein KFK09_005525 [Dendrobium nobile]